MSNLALKLANGTQVVYPLTGRKVLNIGRVDTNDVVISDSSVSSQHAKIEFVDDGYLLTDLRSSNGTFVNEQLVTTHWLKSGDVISIGENTLVFDPKDTGQGGAAQGPSAAGGDVDDHTVFLDSDKYQDMKAKSFLSKAIGDKEKKGVASLSYMEGGEGTITLSKQMIKIGKAADSDVVTSGFFMGKTAATISQRTTGYYISFAGGFIKPKVNGQAVLSSKMLNDQDIVKIGPVKLKFAFRAEDPS